MNFNHYHDESCIYADFKYQQPIYQNWEYLDDCDCNEEEQWSHIWENQSTDIIKE
jgi:hypothetical protein